MFTLRVSTIITLTCSKIRAPRLFYTVIYSLINLGKWTVTKSEKDLGVVIDSTIKPAAHIANCVKKANQMFGDDPENNHI